MSCFDKNPKFLDPKFQCPTNPSQKMFIFDNRRFAKIVEDNQDWAKIDLSQFFVSVESFTRIEFILKPNETKLIEVSNISTLGESFKWVLITSGLFGSGWTNTRYVNFYVTNPTGGVFTGARTWTYNPPTPPVITNFTMLFNFLVTAWNSSPFPEVLNFIEIVDLDTTTNSFKIKSKIKGEDYFVQITLYTASNIVIRQFNTSTSGAPIINPLYRYPLKNAVKILFLIFEYCDECPDNTKILKYTFDNPSSTTARWFNVGDILVLSGREDFDDYSVNLVTTPYIKNPSNCDVLVRGIAGL